MLFAILGMSNGNVYFTLHKYIACAISKPNAILCLYVCQYYNIVLAIIQISTDKNEITTHSYDKQVYRFNFDTCKNCRRRRGQKFYEVEIKISTLFFVRCFRLWNENSIDTGKIHEIIFCARYYNAVVLNKYSVLEIVNRSHSFLNADVNIVNK